MKMMHDTEIETIQYSTDTCTQENLQIEPLLSSRFLEGARLIASNFLEVVCRPLALT